jgi:hypothetical protein
LLLEIGWLDSVVTFLNKNCQVFCWYGHFIVLTVVWLELGMVLLMLLLEKFVQWKLWKHIIYIVSALWKYKILLYVDIVHLFAKLYPFCQNGIYYGLLVPCFGISWELGFEFIADHNMHQLFMADLRINLFLSVLCPKRVHIGD